MTTPTAAGAAALRAPTEHQELWNLIVLQSAAAQSRLKEFHQQVELYIQQTGESPFSKSTEEQAAHAVGEIAVRDRTVPVHLAPVPTVSSFVEQLRIDFCHMNGSVRDVASMQQLTERIKDAQLSVEDKAQIVFVLSASFTSSASGSSVLLSSFEKFGGYGVLLEWFEQGCTFADDGNRSLSRLLLQFLGRHKATLTFGLKTIRRKLLDLQKVTTGRQVKALLKETIEIYR